MNVSVSIGMNVKLPSWVSVSVNSNSKQGPTGNASRVGRG